MESCLHPRVRSDSNKLILPQLLTAGAPQSVIRATILMQCLIITQVHSTRISVD